MIRIVESGNSIISGGGGVEEFEWSTSEQVWPFEKDASGNTLYCKEIDFGAIPNNGAKNVAYNISGLTVPDVFRYEFLWGGSTGNAAFLGPYSQGASYMMAQVQVDLQSVRCSNNANLSQYIGTFRLIYAKN